ncbi:MAG: 1,4-dihydroxy-2-naphthoate octaprenyltransferase [Flavobacteriaceae bacterium]
MIYKAKIWIQAARLRTLPLSLSGIIVGNAMSIKEPNFSWVLFVFMLLTATGFQIISNFANDYGDGVKGTDNDNRIGPKRVLQSGLLSREELKQGILLSSLVSFVLAIFSIIYAFGIDSWFYIFLFISFTFLSIWAAIRYTVGEAAYGYQGFGDLFVFLFFGGLSVMGSYFIQVKALDPKVGVLAIAIGLLAVGVLNLNNMRDLGSDRLVGKRTFAVFLGQKKAKTYHITILISSYILLLTVFAPSKEPIHWLPLLVVFPLFTHLIRVIKTKAPIAFDPELKKLALTTFLLSILIFITALTGL